MFTDTIIAISSPLAAGRGPGAGIRGIVRLSGDDAWRLVQTVSNLPPNRGRGWHAPVQFRFADLSVSGAVMLFQTPASFTGQNIAELHLPNSPALLRLAIETLLDAARRLNLAARLAEPGEFSARAFFNGKIDLTRAEGIAASINARNQAQLRAAAALRRGELFRWTTATAEKTADLLALVEAGIDFADEEDIRFIPRADLIARIEALRRAILDHLEASERAGRSGGIPTAVFIGKPNAGKSSLVNALAGHERSIVSHIAGTTRDLLRVTLHTQEGDICLVDVPGEEPTNDDLRRKMMAAREQALLEADLIVEVLPCDEPVHPDPLADASGAPLITIHTKADLLASPPQDWHCVSATSGLHLSDLRVQLARMLLSRESASPLEHRHREILRRTLDALHDAAALAQQDSADAHPELLAADLRRALDHLGRMTGAISPDEVLGRIFSQFCLGK